MTLAAKTKPPAPSSAVDRAAHRLRVMAMEKAEGALLGSEDELMTVLQVSRPTLRQAAGLVAQEHLIQIRRGVNGGYFASAPSSSTVARMAAIYLHAHDTRLSDLITAIEPIRGGLARLASRNRNGEGHEELQRLLAAERKAGPGRSDYRTFLRAERTFARALGTMSGNSVLALFLDIIYDLAGRVGRDEDVYAHHPERSELYRQHRHRMAQAILEGDEEIAVLATQRCSAIVAEWLAEDLADQNRAQGSVVGLPAR
jgi:GntR family transcriptional repressor for pyruvate dehydrogenase complex